MLLVLRGYVTGANFFEMPYFQYFPALKNFSTTSTTSTTSSRKPSPASKGLGYSIGER